MTSMPYNNICQFNATAAGAANFGVGSAVSGFLTPEQAGATNNKVYFYVAKTPDGLWEWGSGAYSYTTHTLARTTITNTSLGTTTPVNFLTKPVVVVFPSPAPSLELPFGSGTTMIFQNATAPVGWTRVTTYDDCALRIVGTAAPGSGGSNAFSTVFAQTVVGSTTMTESTMPNHAHGYVAPAGSEPLSNTGQGTGVSGAICSGTAAVGGGGSHNHTIIMSIKYVDFMLASKN
jgi:hypothetical protein